MSEGIKVDIEDDIQKLLDMTIFITIPTINLFSGTRSGVDALYLYLFYYRQAKNRKTNQPKANNKFCMDKRGLGWGKQRFYKAKKILLELNLVEELVRRNDRGQITGHYIRIKYKWHKDKETRLIKHLESQSQTLSSVRQSRLVDNQNPITYNAKDINTYREKGLSQKNKKQTQCGLSPEGTPYISGKFNGVTKRLAQKSFEPISYPELYQIAKDSNIYIDFVVAKHKEIQQGLKTGKLADHNYYGARDTRGLLLQFIHQDLIHGYWHEMTDTEAIDMKHKTPLEIEKSDIFDKIMKIREEKELLEARGAKKEVEQLIEQARPLVEQYRKLDGAAATPQFAVEN